ncbi:MAG: hypothetical protein ACREJX_19605 [Polyangiaceae bacterium]
MKKKPRTSASDRVTYRELRNTPGRVWERLAANEILTLVADGKAKAIVIPVEDGNERDAVEAYKRGRAMMAIATMRRSARANGTSATSLAAINAAVSKVRRERDRS